MDIVYEFTIPFSISMSLFLLVFAQFKFRSERARQRQRKEGLNATGREEGGIDKSSFFFFIEITNNVIKNHEEGRMDVGSQVDLLKHS